MPNIKIGIPLNGKMAARTFHQPLFRQQLSQRGFSPLYFLSPSYLQVFDFDPKKYFELQLQVYEEQYKKHFLLQQIRLLRRFAVLTDTTDLRLRETIESKIFDSTMLGIAIQISYINVLRRIPGLGRLLSWLERMLYVTHVHDAIMIDQRIQCILNPGMGNYGFWSEGSFSIEAQRLSIPVFAAITNYDNIVNMGYRSFDPTCIGVWSRQMADELLRLHGFPANRIEITGPVQYDRLLKPLNVGRKEFLKSISLDPNKKTVFFAGGVNINHYYEIYRIFVTEKNRIINDDYNFIVRPQPHTKLLKSPGWQIIERMFIDAGVYVSNPGSVDASGDRVEELRQDLGLNEEVDELNYLLRYSDVLVNNFSTMGLEAAICDLPTIYIGYDSYTFGVRFGVTTGFQQRMTHNRRPLRLKASKVATSEFELLSFIDQYLGDRSLDRESRLMYAVSECGELDGMSTNRLVNMINSRM